MNKQFIIIDYGYDTYGEIPWKGFYGLNYIYPICVLKNRYATKYAVFRFLKKIHLNRKINNIINLPFKYIWSAANYELKNFKWDNNTEYYIIFGDNDIYPMDYKLLNKIKEQHNLHYILYFYDSWDSATAYNARKYASKINFDYIFTFDPADAKKYNYIFYCVPYTMLINNQCQNVEYDLSFIGDAGDRLEMLMKCYEILSDNDLKLNYRLASVRKNDQKYNDKIVYNKIIPYEDVIKMVKESNCILEISRTGQCGESLRYYEAICYNKKLLTTNEYVKEFPFYDARYIKIFKDPEDIDWEWVKRREPIDYHYDGRFSPTHLIDKIIELEEEREKEENGKKQDN